MAKVQHYQNCYNMYLTECLQRTQKHEEDILQTSNLCAWNCIVQYNCQLYHSWRLQQHYAWCQQFPFPRWWYSQQHLGLWLVGKACLNRHSINTKRLATVLAHSCEAWCFSLFLFWFASGPAFFGKVGHFAFEGRGVGVKELHPVVLGVVMLLGRGFWCWRWGPPQSPCRGRSGWAVSGVFFFTSSPFFFLISSFSFFL